MSKYRIQTVVLIKMSAWRSCCGVRLPGLPPPHLCLGLTVCQPAQHLPSLLPQHLQLHIPGLQLAVAGGQLRLRGRRPALRGSLRGGCCLAGRQLGIQSSLQAG